MKKPKPDSISQREIITSIRKPLPPKTGGVHTPKTIYNRKKTKRLLREVPRLPEWE